MQHLKKLSSFFNREEKWSIFGLLVLMLISACFEALGVGLIMPFIALLNNPQIVLEHPKLNIIYNQLNFESPEQFLIVAGLFLLAYYLFKNTFIGLAFYVQCHFIYAKLSRFSTMLYQGYMHNPYLFHTQRNSAQLQKNVINEVFGIFRGQEYESISMIGKSGGKSKS